MPAKKLKLKKPQDGEIPYKTGLTALTLVATGHAPPLTAAGAANTVTATITRTPTALPAAITINYPKQPRRFVVVFEAVPIDPAQTYRVRVTDVAGGADQFDFKFV